MNSSIRRWAMLRSEARNRRHAAGVVEDQLVLGQVEVDRAAAPPRAFSVSNSSPISSNIGTIAA
jgi:hypothetical protein